VGAVFPGTRGPQRSELVPGVFVDQAGQKRSVSRRCKAEEFGQLLYQLALTCGLPRARQLVVLGDGAVWIWRLAVCRRGIVNFIFSLDELSPFWDLFSLFQRRMRRK
jgi:hypothetical protein